MVNALQFKINLGDQTKCPLRRGEVLLAETGLFHCKKILYLTNRFHVAVRLFSSRSQMTSKCGKNKGVARAARECVTDVFSTF